MPDETFVPCNSCGASGVKFRNLCTKCGGKGQITPEVEAEADFVAQAERQINRPRFRGAYLLSKVVTPRQLSASGRRPID